MQPVSRSPFTLYKKPSHSGPDIWYARFWDKDAHRYGATRSTGILAEGKRERRSDAEAAARAMLPSISFKPAPEEILFLDYVEAFWTQTSPYVRERAIVARKPLSARYVKENHECVRLHMASFPSFKGLALKNLTPGQILDWMRWAAEQGLGSRRINIVLQAMRVATRYAVKREELSRDPFALVGEARDEPKERGILSPDELARLIATPASDPRVKAGMLLAALCGLRRGEVRGLLWDDVDTSVGIIHVVHNFVESEGSKAPKCGSARTVPLPEAVRSALNAVRAISPNDAPKDYVFFRFDCRKKPAPESLFRYGFTQSLEAIGIPSAVQHARNLTFHGLRHSYVTMGRLAGISDLVMQAFAGHKGAAMMHHYSHAAQVVDFDDARAKLEKAIAPQTASEGA